MILNFLADCQLFCSLWIWIQRKRCPVYNLSLWACTVCFVSSTESLLMCLKTPHTGLLTWSLLRYLQPALQRVTTRPEAKCLTAGRCTRNDNPKPAPCLFGTICRKAPRSPSCSARGVEQRGRCSGWGRVDVKVVQWTCLHKKNRRLGSSLDAEWWLSTSWIRFNF